MASGKFLEFAELTKLYPSGKEAREDYEKYLYHFSEVSSLEKKGLLSKINEISHKS